jgi:hypothetical protein
VIEELRDKQSKSPQSTKCGEACSPDSEQLGTSRSNSTAMAQSYGRVCTSCRNASADHSSASSCNTLLSRGSDILLNQEISQSGCQILADSLERKGNEKLLPRVTGHDHVVSYQIIERRREEGGRKKDLIRVKSIVLIPTVHKVYTCSHNASFSLTYQTGILALRALLVPETRDFSRGGIALHWID